MATKTISIDLEAYSRLVKSRREKESFSEIIKREVHPPMNIEEIIDTFRKNRLSPQAEKAVRAQIARRRAPINRRSRRYGLS